MNRRDGDAVNRRTGKHSPGFADSTTCFADSPLRRLSVSFASVTAYRYGRSIIAVFLFLRTYRNAMGRNAKPATLPLILLVAAT